MGRRQVNLSSTAPVAHQEHPNDALHPSQGPAESISVLERGIDACHGSLISGSARRIDGVAGPIEPGQARGGAVPSDIYRTECQERGITTRSSGRAIRPPAWRQQEGLTRDELRTHVPFESEKPTVTKEDSAFKPSTAPAKAKKGGSGQRGRKPVVKNSAVVVVPSDTAVAITAGETVNEALDGALATVESSQLIDYETEDEDGKPVTKTKRKARLVEARKLITSQTKLERDALGRLSKDDFSAALVDAATVTFEPFKEGPKREPQPIYPPDLDLDSPFAIFSLFWTEEMWKIVATNTNNYALQQGAIERGRDSTGSRCHGDLDDDSNQRAWWPTNSDELKVFAGCMIYMGIHREGETSDYWHKDIFTGELISYSLS